jgi:hypothetical protein
MIVGHENVARARLTIKRPGTASRPDGAEKIRQPALKGRDSGAAPSHPNVWELSGLFRHFA